MGAFFQKFNLIILTLGKYSESFYTYGCSELDVGCFDSHENGMNTHTCLLFTCNTGRLHTVTTVKGGSKEKIQEGGGPD